jgi:hypothetical protein
MFDKLLCDTTATADRLSDSAGIPVTDIRIPGTKTAPFDRTTANALPAIEMVENVRRRLDLDLPNGDRLDSLLREKKLVFVAAVNIRDWDPCFHSMILGFLSFARQTKLDCTLVVLIDTNTPMSLADAIDALYRRHMLPEGLSTKKIIVAAYTGEQSVRRALGEIADYAISYSSALNADPAVVDFVESGAAPIVMAGPMQEDYFPNATLTVPTASQSYRGANMFKLFPTDVAFRLAERHHASPIDFAGTFDLAAAQSIDLRRDLSAEANIRWSAIQEMNPLNIDLLFGF